MEQKPRVTLDLVGMRARPRPYLHVPERSVQASKPLLMNDVAAPRRHTTATVPAKHLTTHIGQEDFVRSARRVMLENIRKSDSHAPVSTSQTKAHVPAAQSGIAHSGSIHSIHGLVKDIQSASDKSTTRHLIRRDHGLIDTVQLHNEPTEQKKIVFGKWSMRSILASSMALLLMTGGLVALLGSLHNNKLVIQQAQALSSKAESLDSGDGSQDSANVVLSEDPVPESVVTNYSVSSDMPKYISIPKIKIGRNRVLRMGVDKDGAIKVPRNVWDTGWYDGSAKPGDTSGASLIVGHVNGPTNGGVFYNLYRLAVGDEIKVTMGDDTVYTYKVVQKEEVPVSDINMNNYLSSKDIDKPGLTLMTCSGEYNPKTQTYDKRLAVFAIRTN